MPKATLRRRLGLFVVGTLSLAAPFISSAQASPPACVTPRAPTLVPIGGGYDSVANYVRLVAANATGTSIDISVVPSTYAETRAEAIDNGDYDLALEHVAELHDACQAIVNTATFPAGCRVGLVEVWERADASKPAVVSALGSPAVDGVFVLGGDQGAGMTVLAATPSEAAIGATYARGGVIGGTSAGNSVLSRTMTNGYTDYGDSTVGLQLGALDIWDGVTDPLQRGFAFGSTKAIFDQHLYERGRFGRLLNEAARTADRSGNGGLLAIGADTDTSPVVRGDRTITEVFGSSSVTIADMRTLNSAYAWVGTDGKPVASPDPASTPTAALSARDVLVHVLAPRSGGGSIGYDLNQRMAFLDGTPRPAWGQRANRAGNPELTSARPILVGGDLSVGPGWPGESKVLRELVARAKSTGPMLVVAAGYDDAAAADADMDGYAQSLTASGWPGAVQKVVYPATISNTQLQNAAGVIFLGANQSAIPALLADRTFVNLVRSAHARSSIVMLDRSLAAIAGDTYDAIDDSSDAIDAWKVSQAVVRPALGLVSASHRTVAIEPRLQYDYRYGRLFGIPFASAGVPPLAFGISEGSALLVTSRGATVIGENPVITVDTARATRYVGDNGAIGTLNAVVDVFEPAQRIGHRFHPRAPHWFLGTDAFDWTPRRQR